METCLRLQRVGAWELNGYSEGHTKILKMTKSIEMVELIDDISFNWLSNTRFNIILEGAKHSVGRTIGVEIFTDAAVSKETAGAGIVCRKLGIEMSCRFKNHTDTIAAEITAIEAAAETCILTNLVNSHVTIWSDGLEALKIIDQSFTTKLSTLNCVKALNRLAALNLSVKVGWLPKKLKIRDHIQADHLAKGALRNGEYQILNPVGRKAQCNTLNEWETEEKNKLWDRTNFKTSRLMLTGPNDPRLENLTNYSRDKLRLLVYMLTGHAPLKSMLYKMKKTQSENCRFCLEGPESTTHFLLKCQDGQCLNAREVAFGKSQVDEAELHNLEIKNILRFAKELKLDELTRLVSDAGLPDEVV